ncbi:MAG: PaaI family thioesterase [Oceanicaulis sp.]|jgi:1,4-dihydroxy-2-naphthoyl-CoA hydrolase|uniref:PaaI family thioesterase n=1 Tax=Oceanicaulis TaxID=153232 RepID=UPI0003B706CB|nr:MULTISPECIES: PaaI family thioesterase [Oceanicaulis]MAP49344.1 PaaI family thioesterase [Oceanicaulis sp.]MBL4538982.1 PaaI family thioesterase [Oceanicaulis sp.]VXC72387.1 PaaI family thioesterase [Oceanicaulis sp. 350]|tara:strand:+ start:124 stop:555 length:432 start_codon:yes stop_codon:yes gene_type:complete
MNVEQLNARAEGRLAGLVGLDVIEASSTRIRGALTVRPELQAPTGFLHTATIIAMLDTLAGYGASMNIPDRSIGFTTIEVSSSFFGAAREGRVIGEAVPIHRGSTTQIWSANCWRESDNKEIAVFRCTQMVLYPPRRGEPKEE